MKNYKPLAGTSMEFIGKRARMTTGKIYNIMNEEMSWDADHIDYWDGLGLPDLQPEFSHYLQVYDDNGHIATVPREYFK